MSDAKLVKLTAAVEALQTKLVAAQEAVSKYCTDAAATAAALNIPVGTEGSFVFGRGETAKTLTGKVLVVVPTEKGNLLKVGAGEGIEFKVYDVSAKNFSVVVAESSVEELPDASTQDPILDVALEPVAEAEPEVPAGEVSAADAAVLNLL